MNIYKSSVNNPITTILVFVAISIFGVFSLTKLPVDFFPHIETTNIMVITSYPGASAIDIEENVTRPLENTLNSVEDLKHISSQSKENISIITLEFNYGIDSDVATANIRDKLDIASKLLPDDVDKPIIFKFSTEEIPIMLLSIKADEDKSWNSLAKIIDERITTPLARVNGVGTISVSGLPERQIQILCDPAKLESHNVTIEQIAQIVAAENTAVPGGQMDVGTNTYSLRVDQRFKDPKDLESIVIATRNGAPIYLKEVLYDGNLEYAQDGIIYDQDNDGKGDIVDGPQERVQESRNNRVRSGMMIIQKQTDANAVEISRKVNEKLEELRATLPSDVKIEPYIDMSENIMDTASSLIDTILITFIVVMFVVMLMLGRWRAMFIIVLTIPISMLSSLIYLLVTDSTLNIVSMSSISISIGMVVDNAIVVLENITSHVDRGSRVKQAAIFATKEVGVSIIASTLTTLAVFLPLTMIEGMAGVLFGTMGWMVTITLTVSMAAALTFTPVLCSLIMKQNPKKSRIQRYVDGTMGWLERGYGRILKWCVHHRKSFILGAVALFVGVLMFIGPQIKTEFFPAQDNARIAVKIKLPIGTSQEVTEELVKEIENKFFENYPEIVALGSTYGMADTDNTWASMQENGTHYISMNIRLTKKTERKRSLSEICDLMRKDLAQYPKIRTFEVIESGQKNGPGGQQTVDIELYGYDFKLTDSIANVIKERMLALDACSEVTLSRDEYTPEYQVEFDREKLAKHGLNVSTAATYLRNRVNGVVASYYREDGEEYDILARYAKPFRESPEALLDITLYNSQGQQIKVRDVGEIVTTETPPTILRKDRSRYIKISGAIAHGYAMSDLVESTVADLNTLELPAGISWELGGSYEDQQETFQDMIMLLVLMVILVFVIMASQFESLTYPFVIMFSLPFALVGVIIGCWLSGTPMGVMGMLGILMLVGIVVNNGIVLVDYTRLLIGRDQPVLDAAVAAGRSRMRPILMTTLTTVLGMVPMAIGTGVGSEMWNSLGMTVAWGLSFSTLITLFLIPVLFSSFALRGQRRKEKKARKAAKKAVKNEMLNE